MLKQLSIILLLGAAAVIAAEGKKEQGTITIGIMGPMTGPIASWGEQQKRATELALEEVNAADGINGKKVAVIYEDDRGDPQTGLNAFKKLAEIDKVPIVVGAPASNVTLALAPTANKNKVVLISPASSAIAVDSAGPYIFRVCASDAGQSKIIAEWAVELDLKKAVIIYEENVSNHGLMVELKKDFPARGGAILATEASEPFATDFRTQLAKIKDLGADVIFAMLYTKSAGLLIKQARELGLKQQFFGQSCYMTPELIQAGGSAVNGVLYPTLEEYTGNEFKVLNEKYRKKYDRDVETFASWAYDAFLISVEAIRTIPADKKITGTVIRESLLHIKDYHGASGITSYDGKNTPSGKKWGRRVVVDGKHVPYQPPVPIK